MLLVQIFACCSVYYLSEILSFKNKASGAVDSSNALDLSESEEEEELEDIIEDFAVQVPIPTVCFSFHSSFTSTAKAPFMG